MVVLPVFETPSSACGGRPGWGCGARSDEHPSKSTPIRLRHLPPQAGEGKTKRAPPPSPGKKPNAPSTKPSSNAWSPSTPNAPPKKPAATSVGCARSSRTRKPPTPRNKPNSKPTPPPTKTPHPPRSPSANPSPGRKTPSNKCVPSPTSSHRVPCLSHSMTSATGSLHADRGRSACRSWWRCWWRWEGLKFVRVGWSERGAEKMHCCFAQRQGMYGKFCEWT